MEIGTVGGEYPPGSCVVKGIAASSHESANLLHPSGLGSVLIRDDGARDPLEIGEGSLMARDPVRSCCVRVASA
jgi:hypothetical protein